MVIHSFVPNCMQVLRTVWYKKILFERNDWLKKIKIIVVHPAKHLVFM